MSKPVDLITANMLHSAAEAVECLPSELLPRFITGESHHELCGHLARQLLCDLASDSAIPIVLMALKATGGPGTLEELSSRFRAVLDNRASAQSGYAKPDVPAHSSNS